jgi:hypothetical protein
LKTSDSPVGWPDEPKTLHRRALWKAVWDVALITYAILFIPLACFIRQLNGKLVNENFYGRALLAATQYVNPCLMTLKDSLSPSIPLRLQLLLEAQ